MRGYASDHRYQSILNRTFMDNQDILRAKSDTVSNIEVDVKEIGMTG
jgi:hypothetical protein